MSRATVKPPVVPVVANVLARPVTDPAERLKRRDIRAQVIETHEELYWRFESWLKQREWELGTTLGFHRGNLLTEKRVMGIHPQHPTTQARRYQRPIPQAQRLALLGQLGQARHPQPLATE